jgi:hypothetical protein
MSAPAGSCKRSRADFDHEGAPAEADAATAPTEPSRSLLEELRVKVGALEVELAANRRFTNQAQQFVDREEAKLTVPVDEVLVEGMKEEIGKLRTADCTLLRQIRVLRGKLDGWMGWIEEVLRQVAAEGVISLTKEEAVAITKNSATGAGVRRLLLFEIERRKAAAAAAVARAEQKEQKEQKAAAADRWSWLGDVPEALPTQYCSTPEVCGCPCVALHKLDREIEYRISRCVPHSKTWRLAPRARLAPRRSRSPRAPSRWPPAAMGT